MEHTWEKKKNQELKAQNQFLFKEVETLKEVTKKNKDMFDELKDTVSSLQRQLDDKQKRDKQQSTTIKKLTKMCEDLKKEVNDRGDAIKKLEERVTKLQKMPQKAMPGNPMFIPIDDQPEQSRTIQSQIVPGHLLKEIAKPAAEALSAPPSNGFIKTKTPPQVTAVIQAEEE